VIRNSGFRRGIPGGGELGFSRGHRRPRRGWRLRARTGIRRDAPRTEPDSPTGRAHTRPQPHRDAGLTDLKEIDHETAGGTAIQRRQTPDLREIGWRPTMQGAGLRARTGIRRDAPRKQLATPTGLAQTRPQPHPSASPSSTDLKEIGPEFAAHSAVHGQAPANLLEIG